ncbi:autophagy-related protein 17 [Mycena floridula]|nr:autophagy-related protein 17 [Mycena floridula]
MTMASSQPHLASLALQSKKALQYGEQLCSRAKDISSASAQSAVDVLAVDAKVRWLTEAIIDQLKLAADIAKNIEEKRSRLAKQAKEWDEVRAAKTDALDSILEALGAQRVPPDFYQTPDDSSLFGSQHSDDESVRNVQALLTPRHSPSDTVRISSAQNARQDRNNWKTLRDFVDDQGIDDVLERMENEKATLDDILSKTDEFPETLNNTITSIRNSLPDNASFPGIEVALTSQDCILTSMAGHLESLASHYDQMATALRDSEAGEAFSQEDIQAMNRDTDELPSIMSELDENVANINSTHESLSATKRSGEQQLEQLATALDDLDELGEIMTEMLQTQESVESDCDERLTALEEHLLTVEHLHQRFVYYQAAFNKLILEIARRQLYRESAENIVRGMTAQLNAMAEEERLVREHFNTEHGLHLPEDICLCVGNLPTRWAVVPASGDSQEVLPDLSATIVREARSRIGVDAAPGTESL